jgi:hypothetical protein
VHPVQLSVEELIAELSERLRNEDAVERKKSKLEIENAGFLSFSAKRNFKEIGRHRKRYDIAHVRI